MDRTYFKSARQVGPDLYALYSECETPPHRLLGTLAKKSKSSQLVLIAYRWRMHILCCQATVLMKTKQITGRDAASWGLYGIMELVVV